MKETDIRTFKAIKKIGDIIFEYCTSSIDRPLNEIWMEDRRKESVNPYYDQVEQGLFLEMYYGMPSSLHTPWGKKAIGESGSHTGGMGWERYMPEIEGRLGLTLFKPLITNIMGEFGPVYAIHKVDDEELPEPIHNKKERLSYEEAKKAWEEMKKEIKT
jgi:hypothetical protein